MRNLGFWLALSLFLFSLKGSAQICEGNLGDNIFESGDFGSGTANLLSEDPQIAPGYRYSRSTPPVDGTYVITNNTGAWSNLYGTWMELRDNSSDPNGYMMVVNADYTPGNFYEQVVDNLCENTLYEFSADVINIVKRGVTNHGEPNISFLINDEVRYTTGDIPQDERWYTFGFTFETQPGETSVKLVLQNNAPGGIGNDLALDNISFRACGAEALILPRDIANICEDGEPINLTATVVGEQYDTTAFQWQRSPDEGFTWEDIPNGTMDNIDHTNLAGGFYYYRYLLSNSQNNLLNPKCRVNSNVKVVRVVPKFYEVIDTLCEGLTLTVGSSEYTKSGVYTDSLQTYIGCDSIVTTRLTIVNDPMITAQVEAIDPSCFGSEDASITVQSVSNANLPYTIELNRNDSWIASNANFTNLPATDYPLLIQDRFDCAYLDTISLKDPTPFVIDLGTDILLNLGETIDRSIISNYPILSIEENGVPALDCSNCLFSNWQPLANTEYSVTATSEKGCLASDSINISIDDNRRVFIPNAFSPNLDGENEYFTILVDAAAVKNIQQLSVFDRWGNLVFQVEDLPINELQAGWDGTVNGKMMDTGVYTYLFEVVFIDDLVKQYSGSVLLLSDIDR